MRGEVVFMFLAFVAYSVHAAPGNAHKKHTVVAIVVKHDKAKDKNGAAVLKIDGHKISAVSPPALVPQNVQPAVPAPVAPVPTNIPAKPFAVPVNTAPAPQPLPFKPVPVPQNTKPLLANPAPVKQNTQPLPALVPVPQKDQPVAVKQKNQAASDVLVEVKKILNDEKKKKEDDIYKKHPEIYPCDDYSPVCHYYHIQAPDKSAIAQCRDVWMQRNCRKTCGLCKVPYGAFLGCNDLDSCKKMAKSACLHEWVKQTCRSKCGICSPFERVGSSGVFVGKKKAEVPQSKDKEEEMDDGSGATEEESMEAKEEAEEAEEDEEETQEDEESQASGGDNAEDETPQDEEAEASGGDVTEEELEEADKEDKKEETKDDKKEVKKEVKKTTKQRRMILSHKVTQ